MRDAPNAADPLRGDERLEPRERAIPIASAHRIVDAASEQPVLDDRHRRHRERQLGPTAEDPEIAVDVERRVGAEHTGSRQAVLPVLIPPKRAVIDSRRRADA